MKRFIIRFSILVFLPAMLLFCSYEIVTRKLPNSYKLKHEYLKVNHDSIEVLILGSSHGFYGFNPEYFSLKTFNAANVSQPLDYDWNILSSYFNKKTNLKVLILPVLTSSFWGDLHISQGAYLCRKYAIYMPTLDLNETIYNKMELFNPSLFPLLKHLKGDDLVQTSNLGFGRSYLFEKRKKMLSKSGVTAAMRHNVSDYSVGFSNKKNSFDKICEYCNNNKITLYIIRMPATMSYMENLDNELKMKFNSIIKENKLVYDYTYIDFWGDKSFNDLDFYDGDHLNDRGAKKISILLDSIICQTNH